MPLKSADTHKYELRFKKMIFELSFVYDVINNHLLSSCINTVRHGRTIAVWTEHCCCQMYWGTKTDCLRTVKELSKVPAWLTTSSSFLAAGKLSKSKEVYPEMWKLLFREVLKMLKPSSHKTFRWARHGAPSCNSIDCLKTAEFCSSQTPEMFNPAKLSENLNFEI